MTLLLALLACSGSDAPLASADRADSGLPSDTAADADTDVDADTDADSDADTDTGAGTEDDTGGSHTDDTDDTDDSGDTDTAACSLPSWTDADRDGFGAGSMVLVCELPAGRVGVDGDCDDADPAVFPGAPEVCDDRDQDCDGTIDEDAVDALAGYADRDADGWGDVSSPLLTCDGSALPPAGDCDDTSAAVSPDAAEACGDGVDQDCDGVDPLCLWAGSVDVSMADATLAGDATNEDIGALLAPAGDLDGDGCGDLVVASTGGSAGGSAWIAPGATTSGPTLAASLARLTFADCLADVAAAGDLDGDGYADLLVGESCAGDDAGAAHLFYGGPARITSASSARGDAVFEGSVAAGALGSAVASAGDVDGDGLDDLLLADATSVFLGYGSATRSAGSVADTTLPSWSGGAGASPGGDAAGITGGDLDGDGLADLLASDAIARASGADVPGEVHLLYGDAARWAGAGRLTGWDASFVGPAGAGTVELGRLTLAGDLDGDGYAEAIAGSSLHDSSRGTVWVFAGGATRYAGDVPDSSATFVLQGAAAYAGFASSATVVPDLDHTGGDELLVGARGYGAYLFAGVPRSGTADSSAADATFAGAAYVDDLGQAVAAPDLDGDGRPDLAVGAPDTTGGEGIVYLFLGSSM